MLMVAIREHGYGGRRRKPGETFEVRSEKDAIVLRVAGLARNARKSEEPQSQAGVYSPAVNESQAKILFRDVVAATAAIPQPESEKVDDSDSIVYEKPETREEVAEEVADVMSESPAELRKQRRRYKRKDMVPEK